MFNALMVHTALTAGDSEIPFNTIYDDAIGKYVIQRYKNSLLHADEYGNMVPGGVGEANPFWVAMREAEFLMFNRGGSRRKKPTYRRNYP